MGKKLDLFIVGLATLVVIVSFVFVFNSFLDKGIKSELKSVSPGKIVVVKSVNSENNNPLQISQGVSTNNDGNNKKDKKNSDSGSVKKEILLVQESEELSCNGNICSCSDLQNINNCLNCSYSVGWDIDCSETANWNNGAGFKPIANGITDSFTGIFDGQGYKIFNLYINRPNESLVGLFGSVEDTTLKNINLINVSIIGGTHELGALVASIGGEENSCCNASYVLNSSATGFVEGVYRVGGLIGYMDDTVVENCHADVKVHAIGANVYPLWNSVAGGLIGEAEEDDLFMWINNSYATGEVIGYMSAGGLVGINEADIYNSYSTGNVFAGKLGGYAGGLVGTHNKGARVDLNNVSARGDVKSNGYAGGVIGGLSQIGAVYNCSWLNHSGNPSVGVGLGNQVCNAISAPWNSDLPIIIINTFNEEILEEPKISASMTIIDNNKRNFITDSPNFTSWVGIEIRGQSSQQFPKLQYGIETWGKLGDLYCFNNKNCSDIYGSGVCSSHMCFDSLSVPLLGFPSEADWVLSASYSDKTLMRNYLMYNLSNQIGNYASRTRFAEVFLNDSDGWHYNGVYLFLEKIKRDSNRIDINNLKSDENTYPDITGGYILRVDKTDPGDSVFYTANRTLPNGIWPTTTGGRYNGNFYFGTKIINDDPGTDSTINQTNYIKNYLNEFENALAGENFTDPATGYNAYINTSAFIDYFLVAESSYNFDNFQSSFYFYKDRLGKINAGPLWDYDIAYGNTYFNDFEKIQGWRIYNNHSWENIPFWYYRLLNDTNFRQNLTDRWAELRQNHLSTPNVFAVIDQTSETLDESQKRNFEKWDTLGRYTWPNPCEVPSYYGYPSLTTRQCPETYAGYVAELKNWTQQRLEWMDNNVGLL